MCYIILHMSDVSFNEGDYIRPQLNSGNSLTDKLVDMGIFKDSKQAGIAITVFALLAMFIAFFVIPKLKTPKAVHTGEINLLPSETVGYPQDKLKPSYEK